jgi:hypothetical protein
MACPSYLSISCLENNSYVDNTKFILISDMLETTKWTDTSVNTDCLFIYTFLSWTEDMNKRKSYDGREIWMRIQSIKMDCQFQQPVNKL